MKVSRSTFLTFAVAGLLLSGALTACGGGSSDSGDTTASSPADANGLISKQCSASPGAAKVTSDGCIANLGGSIETLVCTGSNTVYRLPGTNHSREAVLMSPNSYTAGGAITLFGVVIQCIV
jgi:hypothetical protein